MADWSDRGFECCGTRMGSLKCHHGITEAPERNLELLFWGSLKCLKGTLGFSYEILYGRP